MLKWFADRLAQTGRDARKDERGFTLIELLVVVIIIGILAAIAIPAFLNQREGAGDAAAQSDLRSAATAQESYYAENDSYTTTVGTGGLADFGFNQSSNVDTFTIPTGADTYCMEASADPGSAAGFHLDSTDGNVQSGGC